MGANYDSSRNLPKAWMPMFEGLDQTLHMGSAEALKAIPQDAHHDAANGRQIETS